MRNLKRALSLAVASVMLLGMMVVGTSADFSDVTAAHNEEAIAVMEAAGIMIGSDGKFNPDQKVTRNEAAVVMANLLGLNVADYAGTSPFTDVPAWAEPYAAAVYANGITAGISATEFGGNNEVTAAQFSLWVMKALGYFQNQADFGDDWQIATVKQASKIELTKGVKAGATAALTRNEVATVVLNALEKDVVDFDGTLGTDIKTSDGTTITVGYQSKYVSRPHDNTYNYEEGVGDSVLQLAEKLFENDLKKTTTGVYDDFGRPSTTWTFDLEEVGTYAKAAKLTYVGGVKHKDLWKALNLAAAYDNFTKWDDGVAGSAGAFDVVEGSSTKIGTAGQTVEVYFDNGDAAKRVIVITTAFDGVVDYVTENSDDERVIVIGGEQFVTEDFEEDDVVIYTADTNAALHSKIKSVALAEKKTGTIDKIVGGTDYYIDGAKYVISTVYNDSVSVGDTVEFYLDGNNYIVKMEEVDEYNAANMAYVLDDYADATVKGVGYAKLLFTDGTTKIVDLHEDSEAVDNNTIVSFVVKADGTYDLTNETESSTGTNATAAIAAGQPGITGVVTATDSKTIFVYAIDNDDNNFGTTPLDVDYKVYTGYKAAPAFSSTDAEVVAYTDGTGAADIVFIKIDSNDLLEQTGEQIVVAYDADIKVVDVKDVADYYEVAAVVDGKITSIKVNASEWADLASNFASKTSIYDDAKLDDDGVYTFDDPTDLIGTPATEIEYSNGTIVIDNVAKAYADDVEIYVIDTDGAIAAIAKVENILEDDHSDGKNPYAHITYTVNSDTEVDLIVLQLAP